MSFRPEGFRGELRPMLRLALPVVLAELGWMGMGVVDTLMVGRIGAEALGSISVARAVFLFVVIFGLGLLLGLDTLVSSAFGAGNIENCHRALIHGVYLAVIMALPATLICRSLHGLLDVWGIEPTVGALAGAYLRAIAWSILPLFLYATFRRYLQAINLVRPVMIALISANLVNVAANWVLIFGHLGAPALGVAGAAWATGIATCYMALFLLVAIVLRDREEETGLLRASWRIEVPQMRRLLGLGFPAGLQLLLEIGVFALVSLLAGRLDALSLAAHQIAITAASVTYMIPLGISSAAAVRVGQALGRDDPAAAGRSGWVALALGGGFMLFAAALFVLLPGPLIRAFTADVGVVAVGVPLIYIAAAFQFFDGVQIVATGALRGAGDTRTPMAWSLIGYWVIGLPVGTYLCFTRGWGVTGLWVGLSTGLIVVGLVLLRIWARRVVQSMCGAAA